jgi:hypothetical protein
MSKKAAAGSKVADVVEAPVAEPAAAQSEKTHDSVVDQVFDAVIARAAKGLVAAKRGLEASARWLEGRAKFVGDLAAKPGGEQAA